MNNPPKQLPNQTWEIENQIYVKKRPLQRRIERAHIRSGGDIRSRNWVRRTWSGNTQLSYLWQHPSKEIMIWRSKIWCDEDQISYKAGHQKVRIVIWHLRSILMSWLEFFLVRDVHFQISAIGYNRSRFGKMMPRTPATIRKNPLSNVRIVQVTWLGFLEVSISLKTILPFWQEGIYIFSFKT